ncbi:MAG: polyamine aminopropyltransferase [Proteobacteria bacterium]|nr:polyamine aminopropyltransferase [Pseudomonadota bacterium]MBI3496815.1 polyamine aminopropyltransferase [Pseudomonadota bacterium]
MTDWFCETLYPDVGQRFAVSKIVHRIKTEHQDLVIFETPVFGRVLALDGVIQLTQKDEFIYHEMLTHVPIVAHGKAKRVLIVGGGDGGILREALRHDVERVTMVEIDRAVVDLSKEYFPEVSAGAFADPRFELVIADGMKFIAETDRKFDVIIVDSTDPQGPGEVLFTVAFYEECKRCLAAGGVLVLQNGVPFFQGDELTMVHRRLKPLFADAACFLAAVPSYYGGFMALGWASDDASLRQQKPEALKTRTSRLRDTRYYSPELHQAAFQLPRFVAKLLN